MTKDRGSNMQSDDLQYQVRSDDVRVFLFAFRTFILKK
jgi:hypothetical protein